MTTPPTASPTPTATPEPTPEPTPSPTAFPTPEPTPILAFQPITLKGRGDKVVRFDIPEDAVGIAIINYTGSGNFAVWTVDSSGDETDLLVNTIGRYRGRVLFDESGHSIAFSISASGSWTITIDPIENAPRWNGAEPLPGSGDLVIRLMGDVGGFAVLGLKYRGTGNFAVWGYGSDRDLLVNEIGNYDGEVLMSGVVLLEITADGTWEIRIAG